MNEKKEIGFEILENADKDVIEKIGNDKVNVSDRDRKHMLEMSMDKYRAVMSGDDTQHQDAVTGVDSYSRPRITRIVSSVACVAAAALLVSTGIMMMKHEDRGGNNDHDQLTATEVNTDSTDSTSQSTTAVTGTFSSLQTHTTFSNIQTEDPHYTETTIAMNPPMDYDTTAVTEADTDAARIRCLDNLVNSEMATEINYYMRDMNSDSVPELFIGVDYISYPRTYVYVFNGEEYVPGTYYSELWEMPRVVSGEGVFISPDSDLINIRSKEGHSYDAILKLSSDNTFELQYESGYNGVWSHGVRISTEETMRYNALLEEQTSPYTWEFVTDQFTNYHGYTDALIKYNQEQQYRQEHEEEIMAQIRKEHPHDNDMANVTFSGVKLIECGCIPQKPDSDGYYGCLHGVATYSDGSVSEQYADIYESWIFGSANPYFPLTFRYGDLGDKPVHAVVFFEKGDSAVTLFDVDFDFPNKAILANHGPDYTEYAEVTYSYESETSGY